VDGGDHLVDDDARLERRVELGAELLVAVERDARDVW
jgi:hypothetical protein